MKTRSLVALCMLAVSVGLVSSSAFGVGMLKVEQPLNEAAVPAPTVNIPLEQYGSAPSCDGTTSYPTTEVYYGSSYPFTDTFTNQSNAPMAIKNLNCYGGCGDNFKSPGRDMLFNPGQSREIINFNAQISTKNDFTVIYEVSSCSCALNEFLVLDCNINCTTDVECKPVDVKYCGDGSVQSGKEQCDDGNTNNGDGCSSTCQSERVDGICKGGPVGSYYDGGLTVQLGLCTAGTPSPVTYDTNKTAMWTCSGKNGGTTQLCTWTRAYCGDGIYQFPNEICDGNDLGNGQCDGKRCGTNCKTCVDNYCGDGKVGGTEECDGTVNCTPDCKKAVASDCTAGLNNKVFYDTTLPYADSLKSTDKLCTIGAPVNFTYGTNPIFGIGRSRECHGTNASPTYCRAYDSYCGDKRIQTEQGEVCDDGNTNSGDGCSSTCQIEKIEGVCDPAYKSQFFYDTTSPYTDSVKVSDPLCKTGTPANFQYFPQMQSWYWECHGVNMYPTSCYAYNNYCGDGGVRWPGPDGKEGTTDDEQCDDGNMTSGDGCSSSCQFEPACAASATPPDGFYDRTPPYNDSLTASSKLCERGVAIGFNLDAQGIWSWKCAASVEMQSTNYVTCGTTNEYCGDDYVTKDQGEQCDGTNPGVCTADQTCTSCTCIGNPSDAVCDSKHANIYDKDNGGDFLKPAAALCVNGIFDANSFKYDPNTHQWSWQCLGKNGGKPAICATQEQRCGDGKKNGSETCDMGPGGPGCSENQVCTDCNCIGLPVCGEKDGSTIYTAMEKPDALTVTTLGLCANGTPSTFSYSFLTKTWNRQCLVDNKVDYCEASHRYCGDVKIQTDQGEQCDDGNGSSTDGCTSSCKLTTCGDGIVQSPNGAGMAEQCDDGNKIDTDNCTNSCKPNPKCGNGMKETGETCDDGNTSNSDACSSSCQPTTCGDGVAQSPNGAGMTEQCDDGNKIDTDTCSNSCKPNPKCGNGIKETGERCDDGNLNDNDTCTNMCMETYCGDGKTQSPNTNGQIEQCDTGGETATCSSMCKIKTPPVCVPTTEICNQKDDDCDGLIDEGNVCTPVCVPTTEICNQKDDDCDGLIDEGNVCTPTSYCGDGIKNGTEQCDDGNQIDTDSCTNSCKLKVITTVCGDNIVQKPNSAGLNEQCDGAGQAQCSAGQSCSGCMCVTQPKCGDGRVDPGEQCDDGNTSNTDKCANSCTFTTCGDSIRQSPNGKGVNERCDDGNKSDLDACTSICMETYCGDGLTQSPNAGGVREQCDDGNQIDTDSCSNSCQRNSLCGNGIKDPGKCTDTLKGYCSDNNSKSCTIDSQCASSTPTYTPPTPTPTPTKGVCDHNGATCSTSSDCTEYKTIPSTSTTKQCTNPGSLGQTCSTDDSCDVKQDVNKSVCAPRSQRAGQTCGPVVGGKYDANCEGYAYRSVNLDYLLNANPSTPRSVGVVDLTCPVGGPAPTWTSSKLFRDDIPPYSCTASTCSFSCFKPAFNCVGTLNSTVVEEGTCKVANQTTTTTIPHTCVMDDSFTTQTYRSSTFSSRGSNTTTTSKTSLPAATCILQASGSCTQGEACDDGNAVNGDGCSDKCTIESCGDTYLDPNGPDNLSGSMDDEQCETSAHCAIAGSTCTSCKCIPPTPLCGNTMVEAGETCDDGNTNNDDGCLNNCQLPSSDQCQSLSVNYTSNNVPFMLAYDCVGTGTNVAVQLLRENGSFVTGSALASGTLKIDTAGKYQLVCSYDGVSSSSCQQKIDLGGYCEELKQKTLTGNTYQFDCTGSGKDFKIVITDEKNQVVTSKTSTGAFNYMYTFQKPGTYTAICFVDGVTNMTCNDPSAKSFQTQGYHTDSFGFSTTKTALSTRLSARGMTVMSPDVDYLRSGYTPEKIITPILTSVAVEQQMKSLVSTITSQMISSVITADLSPVLSSSSVRQSITTVQDSTTQKIETNCTNKCLQTVTVGAVGPVCTITLDPATTNIGKKPHTVTATCDFGTHTGTKTISCGNSTPISGVNASCTYTGNGTYTLGCFLDGATTPGCTETIKLTSGGGGGGSSIICGNGKVDAGELCDEGAANGIGSICTAQCTFKVLRPNGGGGGGGSSSTTPSYETPKCAFVDPPSIQMGEILPFRWELEDDDEQSVLSACTPRDAGKIIRDSLQCHFTILLPGGQPPYSITKPCNEKDLNTISRAPDLQNDLRMKIDPRRGQSYLTTSNRGVKVYGEYAIALDKVDYALCTDIGSGEVVRQPKSYANRVCQFNFAITAPYMIQKGTSLSSTTDDQDTLSRFRRLGDGKTILDLSKMRLLKNTSSKKAFEDMQTLVYDASIRAVQPVANTDPLGRISTEFKKIPAQELYVIEGQDVTLRAFAGQFNAGKPTTIIVKGVRTVKIPGSLPGNLLLIVPEGTVLLENQSCDTADTVEAMILAHTIQTTLEVKNPNTSAKGSERCADGRLIIKGVVVTDDPNAIPTITKTRRSTLHDRFNGEESKAFHIYNGASLRIESKPKIWTDQPPLAKNNAISFSTQSTDSEGLPPLFAEAYVTTILPLLFD